MDEVWNKSKKDSDEVQNLVKDLSANLNSSSDSYFANHKNNNTTSENFGEHLKLEIRDYNKIINRIGKVESYEPTEQELTISELINYSSRVFKIFDIKFTSREAYNLSLGADPAEVLKIRSKNEYNKIVKEMQTYYKSTESNVKVIESISNKNPDNSNLKYIKEVCSIMIDLGKVYINISTTFLKLNLKASTMFRAIPALTI